MIDFFLKSINHGVLSDNAQRAQRIKTVMELCVLCEILRIRQVAETKDFVSSVVTIKFKT